MKKLVLGLSVIAVSATIFVSCCKKGNYTCSCFKLEEGHRFGTPLDPVNYSNADEAASRASCNQMQMDLNATNPGSTCDFTVN